MSEISLITEEYRAMQQQLHQNPQYGIASVGYAPLVAQVVEAIAAPALLDYGAGKGRLGQALKQQLKRPLTIIHYDPAIPQWAALPAPCGLVACIDVLEHIEPDLLDNVLDELQSITPRLGFFSIHTGPAIKVLSDGRNAHLIQKPSSWWLPRLCQRFEVQALDLSPGGFFVPC